MLEMNDGNRAVLQNNCNIVLCYTDWCPLCPPVIEILSEWEQTEEGRLSFIKLNFDHCPQAIEELGVIGIPTVLYLEQGTIKNIVAGFGPKEAYYAMIDSRNHFSGEEPSSQKA